MQRYADVCRYIGEPFHKIYEKWCHGKGIQPELVTLKSGIKAFWMGDHKTAKYIMIYYHGILVPLRTDSSDSLLTL